MKEFKSSRWKRDEKGLLNMVRSRRHNFSLEGLHTFHVKKKENKNVRRGKEGENEESGGTHLRLILYRRVITSSAYICSKIAPKSSWIMTSLTSFAEPLISKSIRAKCAAFCYVIVDLWCISEASMSQCGVRSRPAFFPFFFILSAFLFLTFRYIFLEEALSRPPGYILDIYHFVVLLKNGG